MSVIKNGELIYLDFHLSEWESISRMTLIEISEIIDGRLIDFGYV